MAITDTELARRICRAHHPHLPSPAPCGTHIAQARNNWGLVSAGGDMTLREILRARHEAGLELPYVADVLDPYPEPEAAAIDLSSVSTDVLFGEITRRGLAAVSINETTVEGTPNAEA